MIINKWIQAIAKNITANKNDRPKLAWIYFTDNKAVATDSIKLMEVSYNKNIPDLLNIKNFTRITPEQSIMIKADDINALKIPNTKHKNIDLIQIWNINKECDGATEVSIWVNDTKRETVINTKELHPEFLDYENFFNTNANFTVWVDIEHLMDILKTYKAFWIDKLKLNFDSNNNQAPITILNYDEVQDKNITEVKSILMPLKII